MWNTDSTNAYSQREIKVLAKAVRILAAFEDDPGQLHLAEVCRRVPMPRATAHRILGELVRHGLLERTGETYRLGVRLFEWGSLVQRRLELRRVARPHMEFLASRYRATALLSVRENHQALCVDRVDRGDIRNAWFQIGATLPIHSGGSAKALLAGVTDEELRQFVEAGVFNRMEPPLRVSLDGLLKLAQQVQHDGFSVSDGDVVREIASIGAPIRDSTGRVVAAISLTGLRRVLLSAAERSHVVDSVRGAAAAVSRDLGFTPIVNGETRSSRLG